MGWGGGWFDNSVFISFIVQTLQRPVGTVTELKGVVVVVVIINK